MTTTKYVIANPEYSDILNFMDYCDEAFDTLEEAQAELQKAAEEGAEIDKKYGYDFFEEGGEVERGPCCILKVTVEAMPDTDYWSHYDAAFAKLKE